MPRKKTHEEYVDDLARLKPEFECLGTYQGNKIKILHRHKVCGYKWEIKPNVLLTSGECGCPLCSGKVRKDTEYFKREVYDLVGDEYEVLGEYVNTHTKIKLKHNLCGNEFEMTPHNFISGQRCPQCQHGSKRKTTEEFKQELFEKVGDEYTLEDEYVTNKTKVNFRHKICGKLWYQTPDEVLHGYRCIHCYGNEKWTHDQFENKIKELYGNEFTVVGEYVNNHTKIKMKHNKCDFEWYVLPKDIIHKHSGCPKCNMSKGERRIAKFLDDNNINYTPQMKYDDLKGKCNQRFSYDFYLHDYNILIEYQGQQHEYPVDRFSGEEKFARQQEIDAIKNMYSISHNIELMEIWYYDFDNIEEILTSRLSLKQSA